MPATRYKIWAVGNPVGIGAMQSLHVGVAGIAKRATPDLPYVVVNELICNHLARAVLLPVPPGFVIEHQGIPYYVSLNFNLAGHDLPPANPSSITQIHPDLSCGILLFDIWIVNGDRHAGNISFDQSKNKIQIFDHSHAFLMGQDPMVHLESNRDQLGIGGHCLMPELRSFSGLSEWNERIRAVPEFFIRGIIQSAADFGLSADQIQYCVDYFPDPAISLSQPYWG